MQWRQLGRSSASIPTLTFGAWPIGGGMGAVEESQAAVTVRRAPDPEVTAFDAPEGSETRKP